MDENEINERLEDIEDCLDGLLERVEILENAFLEEFDVEVEFEDADDFIED